MSHLLAKTARGIKVGPAYAEQVLLLLRGENGFRQNVLAQLCCCGCCRSEVWALILRHQSPALSRKVVVLPRYI